MDARQWAGLQVRHLMALEAIAEHGSFHRAATHLNYTQSGISQQLAALERIVGTRLVERPSGARPASLTAQGKVVLAHGQAILARVAAARADLGTPATVLRVGAFQSVGATVLPVLLDRLTRHAPELTIELTHAIGDDTLVDLVRSGDLDVTFAALPLPPGPFASVHVLTEPFVVLVPAGSELGRGGEPVDRADLDGVALVTSTACRQTSLLEARMRDAGLRPTVAHRTDDDGTVLGLVARGAGVACVPRLVAEAAGDRVDVRPLAEPLRREIVLVWHRDREPCAARESFIDHARATLDGHRRHANR